MPVPHEVERVVGEVERLGVHDAEVQPLLEASVARPCARLRDPLRGEVDPGDVHPPAREPERVAAAAASVLEYA
jgi:hypothetical protein